MPADDEGAVRITLKDVYESSNTLSVKVSEAFAELRLTLAGIDAHMREVDNRNRAADEIHRGHENRIRKLEDAQISESTQDSYKKAAGQARWALLAAIIAAAGVAAQYLPYFSHH